MRNKIGNTSCTVPVKAIGCGQDSQLSILLLYSNPSHQKFITKLVNYNKKIMSILQYQIFVLHNTYKNCEIVVISNNDLEDRPKKCRFVENQLAKETGEVDQIRLGLKNIQNENCLIMSGNSFYTKETITNIVKVESSILTTELESYPIGLRATNNYVDVISYAIPDTRWAEIAFFANREFQQLENFVQKKDKGKLFLFEAINEIIDDNGKFKTIKDKDSILYRTL